MSPPLYMISPHQYFLTIETRIIRPSLLFVSAKIQRWRPRLIKVKYLSHDYWHPWKMVLRILKVRLPLMTVQLTRGMALFRSSGYIGGKWKDCDAKFPVYNPATGEEIGKVANMGRSDAEEAVIQAYNAFRSWKNVTTNVR